MPATEYLNSEALFEAVRGLHVADPELGVKPRAAAADLGGARGTGSSERRGGCGGWGGAMQQRCSAKERSRRSTAGAERRVDGRREDSELTCEGARGTCCFKSDTDSARGGMTRWGVLKSKCRPAGARWLDVTPVERSHSTLLDVCLRWPHQVGVFQGAGARATFVRHRTSHDGRRSFTANARHDFNVQLQVYSGPNA